MNRHLPAAIGLSLATVFASGCALRTSPKPIDPYTFLDPAKAGDIVKGNFKIADIDFSETRYRALKPPYSLHDDPFRRVTLYGAAYEGMPLSRIEMNMNAVTLLNATDEEVLRTFLEYYTAPETVESFYAKPDLVKKGMDAVADLRAESMQRYQDFRQGLRGRTSSDPAIDGWVISNLTVLKAKNPKSAKSAFIQVDVDRYWQSPDPLNPENKRNVVWGWRYWATAEDLLTKTNGDIVASMKGPTQDDPLSQRWLQTLSDTVDKFRADAAKRFSNNLAAPVLAPTR